RKTGTWEILSSSRFFKGATSAQKTQLEILMEQKTVYDGDFLIRQNEIFNDTFIVKSGQVDVIQDGNIIESLYRGDFCGEIFKLQKHASSSYDFKAKGSVVVYALEREQLVHYIADNPGIYMRLNYVYGS
ncbi:MAG: cyclic nucleotide-binding domain-containing protein, partial [Spirochaetia bacterium]|nr:cyclic nucleotide-binding domain-containing protein [Spirochaetia bacterium]